MTLPGKGFDINRFKRTAPNTGVPKPPIVASTSAPAVKPTGKDQTRIAVVSRERLVKDILSGIDNLPSLPAIVAQVMQLANDPKSNASHFEQVIRNDQVIAARVLKLVNSSFFGLPNKINSISQATVILGLKTLKSVVLAASTGKLLDRHLKPYGLERGGLWKHSISCATVARLIGYKVQLGGEQAEELFVAGLLHDIGKILLAPHISDTDTEFRSRLEANNSNMIKTEIELFGIDHADVGGRMAAKWQLSPSLQSLIGGHHQYSQNGNGDRMRSIVQLADDVCNVLGIGLSSGPKEPSATYIDYFQTLMPDENMPAFEKHIQELLAELEAVFKSMVAA